MSEAASQGQRTKGGRDIPSLDGLRACSIGLVILGHAQGTRGFPQWIPNALADHGILGVHIFFVISGFLITKLLLEEQAGTGAISLSLFYARRTLRIFPPFYLFLAILGVGTGLGWVSETASNFWFAATYTMNYNLSRDWITGHIWSLSVEEQFYMVWPLTMKLAGGRRAFWIAGVSAVSAPLVCLAVYLYNHELGDAIAMYFPFVADAIAAGCVLAGGLAWLRRQEKLFRWFAAPLGDLIVPLILLLDFGRDHPRIHFAVTETALNVCICYAIVRYSEFPEGLVGRFLNRPALRYVGRLSYSLYLWQQIFMNRTGTSLVQAFPLNVGCSFGCALASYYSVELPLAGLRKRLRPGQRSRSVTSPVTASSAR